jgi:DNA polymerase III alpha subunit (gram-positive type)
MKFIKDLLFFEISTTGPDLDKDNIIQLSAVLIDKDNLLEKDFFNSYIRISYLDSLLLAHSKLLNIDYEKMKKSPKPPEALKAFHNKFNPALILLATQSTSNILFLKSAFRKVLLPFDYNQHSLDLWTLGYVYTLNYGLKKMPSLHTFVEYFKLKQHYPYDALEKARLEAEIFRKIIKEV